MIKFKVVQTQRKPERNPFPEFCQGSFKMNSIGILPILGHEIACEQGEGEGRVRGKRKRESHFFKNITNLWAVHMLAMRIQKSLWTKIFSENGMVKPQGYNFK